jgi:exodeoxyribonuclease VII small subunit
MKDLKKLSYNEAMKRLQNIVSELQQDELSLDSLSDKIKEAKTIIAHCSKKLRATEEELNAILDEEE